MMHRRTFLQLASSAALAAAPAPAVPIKLGFDTYSVRAFGWKALPLVEYAGSLKLDTIQLSSLSDFESLEPAYLRQVRARAGQLRLTLDGGIGCVCPLSKSWSAKNGTPAEYLVKGLQVAQAIGATSMRCFLGSDVDRRGPVPLEQLMAETIKIFRSVRTQAQDLHVKIALENHAGDMQAHEVRTIIEESGKDFVSACLDTGNPMWVVEDPQVTLEVLAPYTVTTHIRDSVVFEHPRGAAAQWVALGDGTIDFAPFVAAYRQLCPQAAMQLEVITGRPPRVVPYREAEFWKAFPHARAAEFARFLALAKNGHPFYGTMVIEDAPGAPPPEYKAALKEQQRRDLERSLEYAKKTLNVGVNWRG